MTPPVRLDLGRLRTDLLRHWLDLVVFDPHGLVGQSLVVERITNWTGYPILVSVADVG